MYENYENNNLGIYNIPESENKKNMMKQKNLQFQKKKNGEHGEKKKKMIKEKLMRMKLKKNTKNK